MDEQIMSDVEFERLALPFFDWAAEQGMAVFMQAFAYAQMIAQTQQGQRRVSFKQAMMPDYWGMALAAAALRDMAREAGFAAFAEVCEQEYQDGLAAAAMVLTLYQAVVAG